MKKQILFYLIFVLTFFSAVSCSRDDLEEQNLSNSLVNSKVKTSSQSKYGVATIYSFYSSKYSSHYYSADPVAPQYYVNEGPAFYASLDGSTESGLYPVYRYYSSKYQDHYYTTSTVTPAYYVNEGIAFWGSNLTNPVYRFYSSKYQDHYLSKDPIAPQYYVRDDGNFGAFQSF